MEGRKGGRPGEKGAGGVREVGEREAGEKEAGSGIPKVTGSGRKGENYGTLRTISQSKQCKEARKSNKCSLVIRISLLRCVRG